jgi:hypothetical protein
MYHIKYLIAVFSGLFCGGVLWSATPANALSVTFSAIGYSSTGTGGNTGVPAAGVTVTEGQSGSTVSITFSTTGWSVSGSQTQDTMLNYTVTAAPGFTIVGLGAALDPPFGVVDFAETAETLGSVLVANLDVTPTNSSVSAIISSNVALQISDNLSLGGSGLAAGADSYTQSFTVSQTPLPAALPLFATGIGGLGLLGWRRKRKAQAVV